MKPKFISSSLYSMDKDFVVIIFKIFKPQELFGEKSTDKIFSQKF